MNGYLENGKWYDWSDRPIRTASRREILQSRWLAWRRRRTYRHLAAVIVGHMRSRHLA